MVNIKDLTKIKRKDPFFYFSPESTVSEIADMMDLKDIGAVPILDQDKKLVGILSERDIVRKLVKTGRDSDLVTAKDIMTIKIKSVSLDTKIFDAQLLLTKSKIRHLPVIDQDKKLINFLSHRDLVASPVKNLKQILTFVTLTIILGLIAVIIT